MSFKIREAHWNVLLEYMLAHPDLARGRLNTAQARKDYNAMWTDLGQKLNSLGFGQKPVEKWQKSWSDYKVNLKKKAAEINTSRQLTGGGPGSVKFLTDFELKVLSILGDTFYKGIGVQEIGVSTNEKKRDVSLRINQSYTESTETKSLAIKPKIRFLPSATATSLPELKEAKTSDSKPEENDSEFINNDPPSLSLLSFKPFTSQKSRQEVQTLTEEQMCPGLVTPNRKIPFRKRPQPTTSLEDKCLNYNNDHDYLANMPGTSNPRKKVRRTVQNNEDIETKKIYADTVEVLHSIDSNINRVANNLESLVTEIKTCTATLKDVAQNIKRY